LTQETIGGGAANGAVSYGLDPVGNRLSQSSTLSGIPSANFTYDADDRIMSTEQYDNNGNTLVSGARTFKYDFQNRLKSMTNSANGVAATMIYDGDGNRVAKTVGSTTTKYLVDDLNPTGYAQVVEEIGTGGVQRTYTYGLQRISQNQLLGSSQSSAVWTASFFGYDGVNGSVRMLTDITGAVTDTYDYDAWGNIVSSTGSTPNVYLYRGEQYDPDLQLYYLRARYFNPLTGRFLSRDPWSGQMFEPQTLHKYMYATGDPVNLQDPRGRQAMVETADLLLVSLPLFAAAVYEAQTHACGTLLGAMAQTIDCIWDDATSLLRMALAFSVRGSSDPYTLPEVNPGRDECGNCNPCPSDGPPWTHSGDAHGSTGGSHTHQIVYDQDPKTCICHPKRIGY
jgi:RHS repeat-associated protein